MNLARRTHERRAARRKRERTSVPRVPERDPAEILEREDLRQRVVVALLALDEPYRTILLLRFYDDLPPREVARRVDAPVETVRTQTRRGRCVEVPQTVCVDPAQDARTASQPRQHLANVRLVHGLALQCAEHPAMTSDPSRLAFVHPTAQGIERLGHH